jgi:hypothetical protein
MDYLPCDNSYMVYIIGNPILRLGISAYGGGVMSVYFSIDDTIDIQIQYCYSYSYEIIPTCAH